MASTWLTGSSEGNKETDQQISYVPHFWDRIGVLLVKFFRNGYTMTGAAYAKILALLKNIRRKRGEMWEGIFLLHDNAPSHTSRVAKSALQELGYITLTHPPYSPDLAPSGDILFPKIKDFLRKWTLNSDVQLEKKRKLMVSTPASLSLRERNFCAS